MSYSISIEKLHENTPELLHLYKLHYAEMKERLAKEGLDIPEFGPRYDKYFEASHAGYLLNFVVRLMSGEPVGYSNVYVTQDMHNGELMAMEDTIFVRKDHRRGIGKKLTEFILSYLQHIGCKSARMQAMTDPRAVKLWSRLGFKPVAMVMVKRFQEDHLNVRT